MLTLQNFNIVHALCQLGTKPVHIRRISIQCMQSTSWGPRRISIQCMHSANWGPNVCSPEESQYSARSLPVGDQMCAHQKNLNMVHALYTLGTKCVLTRRMSKYCMHSPTVCTAGSYKLSISFCGKVLKFGNFYFHKIRKKIVYSSLILFLTPCVRASDIYPSQARTTKSGRAMCIAHITNDSEVGR